jgi:hypothetical protein
MSLATGCGFSGCGLLDAGGETIVMALTSVSDAPGRARCVRGRWQIVAGSVGWSSETIRHRTGEEPQCNEQRDDDTASGSAG